MKNNLLTLSLSLSISLLPPGTASAEDLPEGCYVSKNNPFVCHPSPWFFTPKQVGIHDLKAHYGDIVGSIIHAYLISNSQLENPIEGDTILIGKGKSKPLKKSKNLIKKLKLACGYKCYGIN